MTGARLIDGKAAADALVARVAASSQTLLEETGFRPGLAVVIVGDDPASRIYVRNKGLKAQAAGFQSFTHALDADTDQVTLDRLIMDLNADPGVHGILVQLPLPRHLDANAVLAAIDPDKDVDGFHVVNAGRLAVGLPGMTPCTPLGCLMLLKATLGSLSGLDAVVIGRSNIVGKPMAQLLLAENCTVTIAHSQTKDLPDVCRRADIVIAAVGRPNLVKANWIQPGATVIDVGINRIPHPDPALAAEGRTRVVGDVDFEQAAEVAGAITPVPGGVGPMTIACLLANTYAAASRSVGREPEAF